MQWFSRARLLVLTLICLFWTGLIVVGHFFPTAPFLSVPWRGEQSFEDLLRREGRNRHASQSFGPPVGANPQSFVHRATARRETESWRKNGLEKSDRSKKRRLTLGSKADSDQANACTHYTNNAGL